MMPTVDATENRTITASQPPTTAPMMMSSSRSSSCAPAADCNSVANEAIIAVPSRAATNVAATAGRRCRSERIASAIIVPPR